MTRSEVVPAGRGSVSALQFRLSLVGGVPSLRPIVSGEDLLAGYSNSEGRDPNDLLPPLTDVLLPTAIGRKALIGCCTCGVLGCGALAVLVRRDGQTVSWGPVETRREETLSRTYRFDLHQYLDAVDAASRDRPGEGRGRAAARRVKLLIRDERERHGPVRLPDGGCIDWVAAWPWGSEVVQASVTRSSGQQIQKFSPSQGESDEQFADRVFTKLRWRRPL